MTKAKIVLLISGKRKCGKGFISARILSKIGTEKAEIIRISEPIKSHWTKEKSLDLNELLSDGPYKEQYRKEMIIWSDSVRQRDPGSFAMNLFKKFFLSSGTKPVVTVSDIRRKTDIEFFRSQAYNIQTIRINASDDVRKQRGWKFESGVDDVQSECDLDDFTPFGLVIENNGCTDIEPVLDNAIVNEVLAMF